MKKNYILIIISVVVVLITAILFITANLNRNYDIILASDFSSSYEKDIESNYKMKVESSDDYSSYFYNSKAIEMDEYSAKQLLDAKLGIEFIPSYNIKVVLVKNNDLTDKTITSLNELRESNLRVGINVGSSIDSKMVLMSLSYSLNKEYSMDSVDSYLKELNNKKKLNHKSINLDKDEYFITTNIRAEHLKNSGANISYYDIDEGSLNTTIGLLVLDKSLDLSKYKEALSSHNLKMKEYSNTFILDDYNISGLFSLNRVRKFRRDVLGTYKFSGVNSDERAVILIVFLIIMIPWAIYIGIRINDFEIRKAIIICLAMVLSWLLLRYLRSHMSNDMLLRYIWYLNYLPLLFAPILFLNANIVMSMKLNKKTSRITFILLIVSAILFFLVLTNDIFEFAFIFKDGLDNWSNYSYGWLFYVICLVGFLELIAGIVILIKKNYRQTSKKVLISPVLIFLFIFGYIACDFVGVSYVVELDYTLIICLFALILWEVTLRAGLVQNCGRYYALFNNMTFDLALVNKDNEYIYKTDNFLEENSNTRYSKYDISNGEVILKDDLGVLDKVKKELENRTALLEKNNNTLKHEHKIMTEYYSLASQNEILNEIDLDYKIKNDEIIELINKIEPLKEKKEIYPYLARIKFLVSYTKQKYNCYINSKISEKLEIQTIALAIHIIMEDTKSLNVESGLLCNSMELIDSKLGVIIIDLFYMMMENAINNNSDIFVNIDVNDNYITVFGLFKANSIIDNSYYTNSVKALIDSKKIECETKNVDEMLKLVFKIRSVI